MAAKAVQRSPRPTAEKFIYDGDHVVLDFYQPSGGSYTLEHRYLYGPAVDQVLAQENVIDRVGNTGTIGVGTNDNHRVNWLLTDNLGTVRDIIDNGGNLVAGGHLKYDAYGNILDGDKTLTRYLYTGREFDATTGLQYNRNRWYDSKSGRWLCEDPIGLKGGDYNLYRYVGNDPTNATDPSGEIVPIIAGAGLAIWIWIFTPSNAHAPGNQQEADDCAALDRQRQSQNMQNTVIIVGGYGGGRLAWQGLNWYFQPPGPRPPAPRPTQPPNSFHPSRNGPECLEDRIFIGPPSW